MDQPSQPSIRNLNGKMSKLAKIIFIGFKLKTKKVIFKIMIMYDIIQRATNTSNRNLFMYHMFYLVFLT